jgi:hypothetical protein
MIVKQGISQVLIVSRVNLSKFTTVSDLAKTITVASENWDNCAVNSGNDSNFMTRGAATS